MFTYSNEHKKYLDKLRKNKYLIIIVQILIISVFLIVWEILAKTKVINPFLYSSPSNIFRTIINLIETKQLFNHISITVYETFVSFLLASFIGIIVAMILWWFKIIAKIVDPYLTIINSLPKIALGPLIIIWVGASTNSIIFMALLISTIISIINIYNGFISTDRNYITLLKSFGATKHQIFYQVVLPSNKMVIINSLKINISMSLIGVIMGELLVSKEGLGYLIMYGSQVFNINLVITAVFILGVVAYLMYYIIVIIERKINNKTN